VKRNYRSGGSCLLRREAILPKKGESFHGHLEKRIRGKNFALISRGGGGIHREGESARERSGWCCRGKQGRSNIPITEKRLS